jgi:hypothetical protein
MPYKKGFLKGIAFTNKTNKDLEECLKPLPRSIKLIKTRDKTLPNPFREEGRDINPIFPLSK